MGESCIFCKISKGEDKETEILQLNEELVCFRDIYPVAPHHYLVVPKEHIVSCLSLQWHHHSLVERMTKMGKAVLQEQGVCDMKHIKMGFHIPPFTSVDHLHLHVVAPSSQISKYLLYKFTPGERFVEDGAVVCVRDLKPGATHHYLIISKKHIDNCIKLQPNHIQLVEQMKDMGMRMLQMNNVSDLEDIRMGFHVPPFSSVPHLHLHVLAPFSQMSHRSMLRYGPQSHWFITVDNVLSQLKTRGKVK